MSGQVLRVLTYHRVLDGSAAAGCNPSLVSATPAGFKEQVRHLARRYRVVSGEEVVSAYRDGGRLPNRAVLITFDDGYRDVGEVAWPILRRFGLPATVFVPTAFVDSSRRFWWDRLYHAIQGTRAVSVDSTFRGPLPLHDMASRASTLRVLQAHVKSLPHVEAVELVDCIVKALGSTGEPPPAVLGWDDLRELSRDGMTLGAHTRTHPVLTRVPVEEARLEIRGCREDILRETGSLPSIFAYPFGAHDADVMAAARSEGVAVAVTCLDGHNEVGRDDPVRLCRTNITPRTTLPVFRFRLSWIGPYVDRWRHGKGTDAARPPDSRRPDGPRPRSEPASLLQE